MKWTSSKPVRWKPPNEGWPVFVTGIVWLVCAAAFAYMLWLIYYPGY